MSFTVTGSRNCPPPNVLPTYWSRSLVSIITDWSTLATATSVILSGVHSRRVVNADVETLSLRRRSGQGDAVQQRDQLARTDRLARRPHAERRERVPHRVHHRGRRADRTPLAHALVPARQGRRRLDVGALHPRYLGRRRHQVVEERTREGVAQLVVDHVLVEHATDPLHGAAGDLSVDDHRVDDDPAVLADDEPVDARLAGADVDLAHADMARVRPRVLGPGEPFGRFEPRRD